jgi:hypothetical protein
MKNGVDNVVLNSIVCYDAEAVRQVAWLIRAARLGRVKRRGRRGRRRYDITLRNVEEMPYSSRKFLAQAC